MFDKYKCPENFPQQPPKVNPELWKLLNSWQRKSDVKFSMMQKCIKKAMNCGLTVLEECQKDNVNIQNIAQSITDMSALLGYSSYEISLKRRVFIRNVINTEYKDLCSPNQPMTTQLFGDDLPKVVKELKLTNAISNRFKPSFNKQTQRFKQSSTYNKNYFRKNPFLGQGRETLLRDM